MQNTAALTISWNKNVIQSSAFAICHLYPVHEDQVA